MVALPASREIERAALLRTIIEKLRIGQREIRAELDINRAALSAAGAIVTESATAEAN